MSQKKISQCCHFYAPYCQRTDSWWIRHKKAQHSQQWRCKCNDRYMYSQRSGGQIEGDGSNTYKHPLHHHIAVAYNDANDIMKRISQVDILLHQLWRSTVYIQIAFNMNSIQSISKSSTSKVACALVTSLFWIKGKQVQGKAFFPLRHLSHGYYDLLSQHIHYNLIQNLLFESQVSIKTVLFNELKTLHDLN